jgi:hypothetical protein
MKLLIKIAIKNLNTYDVLTIADEINAQLSQPQLTEVVISTPRQPIDVKYHSDISIETSSARLINSNLDKYKWDIVLPITEPFIPLPNFDDKIREQYQKAYPALNGVLWLNDGAQQAICTLPVIGRKYYEEFGYVYNPAYANKNFDKEFTEVLKIKKSYTYINDALFTKKIIIPDDDNIYQFREKHHFGLTPVLDAIVVARPAPVVPPVIPVHINPKHPTVRFTRKHINKR